MMNKNFLIILAGIIALFPASGIAQQIAGISSELEDAFLEKPRLAKIQDIQEKISPPRKEELPKETGDVNPGMKDPPGDSDIKKTGSPEKTMKSKTGAKTVSINFNGVPLNDALLSLARQAGVSITIDRDIDVSKVKVTAYYEGESFEDAITSIVSGLDYAYRKVTESAYAVTPYEEAVFDVQDIHIKQREPLANTSNAATGSTGGLTSNPAMMPGIPGNTPSQPSGSISTSSGNRDDEGEIIRIVNSVRKILSAKGVVTPMTSGFIYVRDVPSRVKMVKEMLDTDVKKRKTITMKITLLRIDYKDEYETGINWSAILETAKGPTFGMNINFMQGLGTAGDVSAVVVTDKSFTGLLKMLGTYGDINVVHSWESKAVSGAILPFEMSQTLWYTTGTTIQVINNQTINSAQVAPMDIGIKLTVNPLKLDKGYLVNTSVDLSNFLGFQYIDKMELPQIERNYVSIPIKMGVGDTVAISGFKMKSTEKKRLGIPFLSKVPVLGLLFGYTGSKDKTSELTILIHFIDEKDSKA